jgi:serine/threonine protein kinase
VFFISDRRAKARPTAAGRIRTNPDGSARTLENRAGRRENASVARTLAPGETLGAFILERRLGSGGMAEVWAASRAADGARVALKVLRPDSPREIRVMFADEIRLAERLRHPNIVFVHGPHSEGDFAFLEMELVEGQDLAKILAAQVRSRELMPYVAAIAIARDVALALAFAHAARSADGEPLGIVHRDVSPQNVIVTPDGKAKLLDFGIARARQRQTKTKTGVIKGKLAYLAPEQALGLEVTSRTDIYGLGVVLWEMLATRRLFRATQEAALLAAVTEGRIPDVREACPSVPIEAAALVRSMTALDPADRPESIRVVEGALSRLLFGSERGAEDLTAQLSDWLRPILARRRTPARRIEQPPEVKPVMVIDGVPIRAAAGRIREPEATIPDPPSAETVLEGEMTQRTRSRIRRSRP